MEERSTSGVRCSHWLRSLHVPQNLHCHLKICTTQRYSSCTTPVHSHLSAADVITHTWRDRAPMLPRHRQLLNAACTRAARMLLVPGRCARREAAVCRLAPSSRPAALCTPPGAPSQTPCNNTYGRDFQDFNNQWILHEYLCTMFIIPCTST